VLRRYDGSDEDVPILLAVGGKVRTRLRCEQEEAVALTRFLAGWLAQVLDVTSGAKFYAKGKAYNQFAGTVQLAFDGSPDSDGLEWLLTRARAWFVFLVAVTAGLHARAHAGLAQEGGALTGTAAESVSSCELTHRLRRLPGHQRRHFGLRQQEDDGTGGDQGVLLREVPDRTSPSLPPRLEGVVG
jgi:hypothetical protein